MWRLIKPGWPDEARLLVQQPVLHRLTVAYPLSGRCLNAGCGEGLYCQFIEGFAGVTEIVNVDLAGTNRLLSRLSDARHRAVDASLTALPFLDQSFDSCVCTEVLEHIADDDGAIGELARCVRPGGTLLASVPHPPAPDDPNHVRAGYSLRTLSDLLGRHGFRVVASERCFGLGMNLGLRLWRWQYRVVGRGLRNLMPRALVFAFGYFDRWFPLGDKWDLVVVAVKEPATASAVDLARKVRTE